jgi:hypothetical protein
MSVVAPNLHVMSVLTFPDVTLVALGEELSRVTRPDGEVLGYVERFSAQEGLRYRAKRYSPTQRRFMVMGEFWNRDDAVETFRAS